MTREVGRGVRRLREDRGLSLTECARLAGLNPGTLCHVERGDVRLSESVGWRLSKVLGPEVFTCCDRGRLLRHIDLRGASRRHGFDEQGRAVFTLCGGVAVAIPRQMLKSATA